MDIFKLVTKNIGTITHSNNPMIDEGMIYYLTEFTKALLIKIYNNNFNRTFSILQANCVTVHPIRTTEGITFLIVFLENDNPPALIFSNMRMMANRNEILLEQELNIGKVLWAFEVDNNTAYKDPHSLISKELDKIFSTYS